MEINKTAAVGSFSAVRGFLTGALATLRGSKAVSSAGKAAKLTWQAGRGSSRLGGRSFSFTGLGNPLSRVSQLTEHSNKLSNGIVTYLRTIASKDPKVLNKITELAKKSELKGNYFDNKLTIQSISDALKDNSKLINDFLINFHSKTNTFLKIAPSGDKKAMLQAIKEVENVIKTNGIQSKNFSEALHKIPNKQIREDILKNFNVVKDSNEKVFNFISALQQNKILTFANKGLSNDLLKATNNLQFVKPTHYISSTNLSSVSLLLFGAGIAGSGLVGENISTVKELKNITDKIKEELLHLPVKNNIKGKAWEEHRDKLITSLSVLDVIDIKKYETAGNQDLSIEEAEGVIISLDDLSRRFEVLSNVFLEISTSNSLKAKYEAGSEGLKETIQAGVDSLGEIIGKYIAHYNKAVELSKKGLQALNNSAIKIEQGTQKLTEALEQKSEANYSDEISTEANEVFNNFILTGFYLNEALNYRFTDKIKNKLNKTAVAPLAILGGVAKGFTVLWAGSEIANFVLKTYSDFTIESKKLNENTKYILNSLKNFNDFKPKNEEQIKFKEQNDKLIISLENNIKFLLDNFPKVQKVLDEENNENVIVDKDNLNKIKICLKNIENIYEVLISEQWGESYKKHARSIGETILATVGFSAFVTGRDVFDSYSRFIRYAKKGVVMLSSLQVNHHQLKLVTSEAEAATLVPSV